MQRRCTDSPCLLLLLAFLAGLGYIATHAARHGNVAKLTSGIDWRGRICGVDEGVEEQPLLFWCRPGAGDELQLLDGVCVSSCPTGTSVRWCPGEARPYSLENRVVGVGEAKQVVVGTHHLKVRNATLQNDYKTVAALGYCFPSDNFLLQELLQKTHVAGPTKQLFLAAHGAIKSWRFLLGASAVSLLLGYAFLFLLWMCFDKLVYIIAGVVHLMLLLAATGCGYMCVHEEYNFFLHWFHANAARLCAASSAGLLLLLWVLVLLLHIHSKDAVSSTVESVNSTCEAIAELPSLLLQPLLHSTVTVVALVALIYGFIWVLSTGKVIPNFEPVQQGGVKVAGLHRTLEFTAVGWLRVLYWVFGTVWILETMNALGQFAISHAVVSYRHSSLERRGKPCFPVLCGYCVGVFFHMGSLAFAGFVLGALKILAAVLTFLARQARDEAGVRGALARAVCCCCAQCALCLEQALSMVNDLVYTDVALQGSRYLEAAENVVRVAASNPAEYALLKGSATAVRIFGVLVITAASTVLAHQSITNAAFKSLVDERVSPAAAAVLETESLQGTLVAVGIISFQIAMTFMTVFYQTTHTLTYCMLIGDATVGSKSPCNSMSNSMMETRSSFRGDSRSSFSSNSRKSSRQGTLLPHSGTVYAHKAALLQGRV